MGKKQEWEMGREANYQMPDARFRMPDAEKIERLRRKLGRWEDEKVGKNKSGGWEDREREK